MSALVVEPAKTLIVARTRAVANLKVMRKVLATLPVFPEQSYYGTEECIDPERLARQFQDEYLTVDRHIGSSLFDPSVLRYLNLFDQQARQIVGHAKFLAQGGAPSRRIHRKEGLVAFHSEAMAALGNVTSAYGVSDRLMIHHTAYLNGSLREIMNMVALRFVPEEIVVETPKPAVAPKPSALLVSA